MSKTTNKIIAIICCAMCILGLVGYIKGQATELSTTENTELYVYVDKETGVNYIIFDDVYKGGICPRYNADGSLYIEGVK